MEYRFVVLVKGVNSGMGIRVKAENPEEARVKAIRWLGRGEALGSWAYVESDHPENPVDTTR